MYVDSTLTRKTFVKVMLSDIFHSSNLYLTGAIIFAFIILGFRSKSLWIYPVGISAATVLFYTIWLVYQCFARKNRNFFIRRQFIFNDENIVVKISAGEQVIKWEAFQQWKKMAGCYVLIFTNSKRIIIPKSDISSSEVEGFENLLIQKIDKITIKKK
jgi:hypothetical protein